MAQLVSNFSLLINDLFQSVVRSFLRGLDLGSENLEGFIHLEPDLVPFEVLDVILHLNLLGSSSVTTDFNDEARWLIELFADVEVHLFIPLATSVNLNIIFGKNVHKLHQLIQRPDFELGFVNLKIH
jgi:hypothetical protein